MSKKENIKILQNQIINKYYNSIQNNTKITESDLKYKIYQCAQKTSRYTLCNHINIQILI